jgi:hypothetical protein
MRTSCNIAENRDGSYRPLAILRWVMVVIFVSFGMQKFTLQSAQGLVVLFLASLPQPLVRSRPAPAKEDPARVHDLHMVQ